MRLSSHNELLPSNKSDEGRSLTPSMRASMFAIFAKVFFLVGSGVKQCIPNLPKARLDSLRIPILRGFPITEISTIKFFSGLPTFLKQRVDSADTVQRFCTQCLHALVAVTAQPKKNPFVAIITVNPRTEPTPPVLF